MSEADTLGLPRPSRGCLAHLYFDLFSFHYYFQTVLATAVKLSRYKAGSGIHERLSAQLVIPHRRFL